MAVHGADVKAVFWPMVPVLLILPRAAGDAVCHYLLARGRIPDAFYREALGAVLERFDTFYSASFAVICALVIFAMLERATTLAAQVRGVRPRRGRGALDAGGAGRGVRAAVGAQGSGAPRGERHLDPVMWRLNAPELQRLPS